MIHKANPDWGTHIPVLIKVMQNSTGPVLELGMGISSTPLLHALCFDQNRELWSFENDRIYYKSFFKYAKHKHHFIALIQNWDLIENNPRLHEFTDKNWGVILIDHKPEERRKIDVEKFKDNADFLVLHDSEPEHNDLYHYDEIYPLFKYRYDYTKTKVHTTVLSNFHDTNFLHNP